MTLTLFQIYAAVIMVGVSVVMLAGFQQYLAAASAGRMTRMMARIGMTPSMARGGSARRAAVMRLMRHRCRRCSSEDLCERWVAGKASGGGDFCPNARAFGVLART
jgi:hypothetical protein